VNRVDYLVRKGAYVVIVDGDSVAAIQGPGGYYFLPGGGIEENESDEETLIRELKEECDASVEILGLMGQATDFLFAAGEDRYFEKRGSFYLARFLTLPDKNLVWIPIPDASKLFRQEGHVWAIKQALEKRKA